MINGYADISETNQLKDEISALKLKNCKENFGIHNIYELISNLNNLVYS